MPTDSQAFISEWKGKPIDGEFAVVLWFSGLRLHVGNNLAVVEQVKDGSTVRVRLLMPDGEHQFINLSLAGVRSPRVSAKPGEVSEPWSEEVRFRSSPSQRHLLIANRFIGQIFHRVKAITTDRSRTASVSSCFNSGTIPGRSSTNRASPSHYLYRIRYLL